MVELRVERVDKQFVGGEASAPVALQEHAFIGHPPHFALLDQNTLREFRQQFTSFAAYDNVGINHSSGDQDRQYNSRSRQPAQHFS